MPLEKQKYQWTKHFMKRCSQHIVIKNRMNASFSVDKHYFVKWWEKQCVFDSRTPQQKKSGKGNIMKLSDILKTTQEEADSVGVGVYRKALLELEARKSPTSET